MAILILADVSKNYFSTHPVPSVPFFGNTATATIDGKTFNLYLAKSEKQQEIGLSGRTSLKENYGMLFVFRKPGTYPFWMKNMRFPIDIIYINKGKIVQVFSDLNAPTDSKANLIIYKPEESADRVLEINAGLSKKYDIKKGDSVKTENL
ncbi:MAG: DUF192 domain-containing protein [Patescibacteria group bacterium]|nr:DUF192 domain-containing protein [Patescibacteria group bacterium]